jgi:hypothetical protein
MMHDAIPREIELADATAGMTLAAAVLDDHGSVLLSKDAQLSDSVLASLRRRGLHSCVIWAPLADDDPRREAAAARALGRLDGLFRHTGQDEANTHLLDLLRAYRNGTLA